MPLTGSPSSCRRPSPLLPDPCPCVPAPALHLVQDTVVPPEPPPRGSSDSLGSSQCCSQVLVPKKCPSAVGELYWCRAVKGLFPVSYGMLVILLALQHPFVCLYPSERNYFIPLIITNIAPFLFCFPLFMIGIVFPVDDLWCKFISQLISFFLLEPF